jgi:2-oxoglutarate ferredoxin oxidoreductase subunit beta
MTASGSGSLLECGSALDDHDLDTADFATHVARWCPGCGDHSILTAVHRLLAEERLAPERTVFVSGIGCSSRLPHYVRTYGFHGIHGRALPIATGVKLHRPDLDVFVVMGDGDCCSIGAAHWIHAVRYNMDLTVLLFDNAIYALTKDQTSPTTPKGYASNTQPKGSWLPALNPLSATLGVTNCSFVAQTAEWAPQHLFETLRAAHRHRGFSFVRILQRCPVFSPDIYLSAVKDPGLVELLVHEDGVGGKGLETLYRKQTRHDPKDLDAARRLASATDRIRLGVLYRDASAPRYEETRRLAPHTARERMDLLEAEFDRHAV